MKKFTGKLSTACYRTESRFIPLLGAALILVGLILLIFCVPLWAYLGLIGAALIIIGIFLLLK